MAREKSPALKILWIWTLGTAAIMVTNAVRTRLKDMEQVNGEELQQQQQKQSGNPMPIILDSTLESDE